MIRTGIAFHFFLMKVLMIMPIVVTMVNTSYNVTMILSSSLLLVGVYSLTFLRILLVPCRCIWPRGILCLPTYAVVLPDRGVGSILLDDQL